jgi:chaperonin cofactor prefoldin
MEEQLLLFAETKEEKLERQVKRLQEQCDKIRKSLYARHGDLMKMYLEQKYEMEILKASMCRS